MQSEDLDPAIFFMLSENIFDNSEWSVTTDRQLHTLRYISELRIVTVPFLCFLVPYCVFISSTEVQNLEQLWPECWGVQVVCSRCWSPNKCVALCRVQNNIGHDTPAPSHGSAFPPKQTSAPPIGCPAHMPPASTNQEPGSSCRAWRSHSRKRPKAAV